VGFDLLRVRDESSVCGGSRYPRCDCPSRIHVRYYPLHAEWTGLPITAVATMWGCTRCDSKEDPQQFVANCGGLCMSTLTLSACECRSKHCMVDIMADAIACASACSRPCGTLPSNNSIYIESHGSVRAMIATLPYLGGLPISASSSPAATSKNKLRG
jgi:hypothetical protein